MKITIKTTHFEHTSTITQYVEEKIGHLAKFNERIQLARVELEYLTEHNTKEKFRAEATVDSPKKVYRAEATGRDIYAAIDLLEEKLTSQIEKIKEKSLNKAKKTQRFVKNSSQAVQ